jgi:perosamine synthetase
MTDARSPSMTQVPLRRVPAAKIQFLQEDRAWIAERIKEVLTSGQLTLGKYGAEFEKQFALFCGVNHGIAVNSGTSSLEIILRGLGVEGKDVVVPTNTFFATAAAVVHAGGTPVFVDMDPDSFAVLPEAVERSLTRNTAGIIVVHIGGIVSNQMPELARLAASKGLWLVEDAAHAHGSSYRGTSAGAFGVAGSFSFYPTKVMTCGEGGMITTNDSRLADASTGTRGKPVSLRTLTSAWATTGGCRNHTP